MFVANFSLTTYSTPYGTYGGQHGAWLFRVEKDKFKQKVLKMSTSVKSRIDNCELHDKGDKQRIDCRVRDQEETRSQ